MMEMQRIFAMLIMIGIMAACGPSSAPNSAPDGSSKFDTPSYKSALASIDDNEVFYRDSSGDSLQVFNIEQEWFAYVDRAYVLNPDKGYGEFGGGVEFCSNTKFFCLRWPYLMAAPKELREQTEWSIENMSCEVEEHSVEAFWIIVCSSPEGATRFGFAAETGVEWYENARGEVARFTRVSSKGLFAPGSRSALLGDLRN